MTLSNILNNIQSISEYIDLNGWDDGVITDAQMTIQSMDDLNEDDFNTSYNVMIENKYFSENCQLIWG